MKVTKVTMILEY